MRIEIANQAALLLLLLIPPVIYLSRRSLANLSRIRTLITTAVRVVLIVLIVLSLAGVRFKSSSNDVGLIFLVDVSASVPSGRLPQTVELINRQIEQAAPNDYLGVVAFGGEPSIELFPTRKIDLGDWRLTEISSNPSRDQTNIADALRLAAAIIPPDAVGRIVLVTDGEETLKSAMEQASFLKSSGIEVFTEKAGGIRAQGKDEISVRSVDAPNRVAEGEAFDLNITVDSTSDSLGNLRVFRNDSLVSEREVQLVGSGENIFVVPQRGEKKGLHTYRAEIDTNNEDGFLQNNRKEAFTIVEGGPRTLYLYGDNTPSSGLTRVLSAGLFSADVRSAAAIPTSLAGFQNYDLVIFDNVPASALTTGQMRMIQTYVRDLGGGFVMVGGENSFGPGGYFKTPVEEVLPVSLDVRKKKHLPSLAMVIVIDKSGSMAGIKMLMTLEAAMATVDLLSERDFVGVVGFDSEATAIVELSPIDAADEIKAKIKGVQPFGGTNIYSGLKMANEWLRASEAQLKHVILLSDGASEPGDLAGMVRSMRDADITLTSVAVGEDADLPTMRSLAMSGGGRFYDVDRPENLPRVFTREAFLASRSTIIEEPFQARLSKASQATSGIDWSSAPELRGYVASAERDAEMISSITSLLTHKDDPLYAFWQYGLGRSAAFTADAKPRWASSWLSWTGFGQFWTQVFRETIRRSEPGTLQALTTIEHGRGLLKVEATNSEGLFLNNLQLSGQVIMPDLSTRELAFHQSAPGEYEAEFPAMSEGAYFASVSSNSVGSSIAGVVNSYSAEYSLSNENSEVLRELENSTGGRAIEGNEVSLFSRASWREVAHDPWEVLILLSVILLPLDIGLRRIRIEKSDLQRISSRVFSRLRQRAEVPEVAESDRLKQLRRARSRVVLADTAAERLSIEPETTRKVEAVDSSERTKLDSQSASDEEPLASRLL
jgi:Ca-activated chloride channel homolog